MGKKPQKREASLRQTKITQRVQKNLHSILLNEFIKKISDWV